MFDTTVDSNSSDDKVLCNLEHMLTQLTTGVNNVYNHVNKNLILGMIYNIKGNNDLCIEHYRLASAEGDNNATINLINYLDNNNIRDQQALDNVKMLSSLPLVSNDVNDVNNVILRAKNSLVYHYLIMDCKYEMALELGKQALSDGYVRAASNIGFILATIYKQYDEAISYSLLLIQHGITDYYDYTAHFYELKGDIVNAHKYYILDYTVNGNLDSIIYLYNYYYNKQLYQNAIQILFVVLEYVKSKSPTIYYCDVYLKIGMCYFDNQDYDNCLKYSLLALEHGSKESTIALGMYYRDIARDYTTAIKYLLTHVHSQTSSSCVNECDNHNKQHNSGNCSHDNKCDGSCVYLHDYENLFLIGEIYNMDLHDVVNAEKYYNMCYESISSRTNTNTCSNPDSEYVYKIAMFYLSHNSIDNNIEKARAIIQFAINNSYNMAHTYMAIICHDKDHNPDTAIEHFTISLSAMVDCSLEVKQELKYNFVTSSIGRCYMVKNDYDNAVKYFMLSVSHDVHNGVHNSIYNNIHNDIHSDIHSDNHEHNVYDITIDMLFNCIMNITNVDTVILHVKQLFSLLELPTCMIRTKILTFIVRHINPDVYIDDIIRLMQLNLDYNDKIMLTKLVYTIPNWHSQSEITSLPHFTINLAGNGIMALNTGCPICLSEDCESSCEHKCESGHECEYEHVNNNDCVDSSQYCTLSCRHKICSECLKIHVTIHYLCPLCKTYIYV